MKKIYFLLLFIPFLVKGQQDVKIDDSKAVLITLNHKSKVFAPTSKDSFEMQIIQYYVDNTYKYIDKYYKIKNVPNIYLEIWWTTSKLILSNDVLNGSLMNSDGEEMNTPDGKKGIKIMTRMDIDTIFHLLDYGVNNYNRLVYITDSIIKLPYSERPKIINLSSDELKQALDAKLNKSKQKFIRKFKRKYSKKFNNYVNNN